MHAFAASRRGVAKVRRELSSVRRRAPLESGWHDARTSTSGTPRARLPARLGADVGSLPGQRDGLMESNSKRQRERKKREKREDKFARKLERAHQRRELILNPPAPVVDSIPQPSTP
ncbi:MAG: hypothetical protein EPO68_05820, partial [Planctomycetota bacterium]